MFDHYLITRFNLRNPKWDVTKNNESLLTDDWMEDRMWLFENFCFPSVTAQVNQNFEWLLFFDTTTSDKFKNRITELTRDKKNITIFFIDGMPAFYDEIQQYITTNSEGKSHLITSRIDNDDSISKYFIDEVQKQFKVQDYQAIDIINGYSLQVKPNFILGKKEHIFNPFISLIEKNDHPKTVWFSDHNMWKKETRITQITNKRLWLSIIHEKNKVNEFDGYGNIKWEDINGEFILSEAINKKISTDLAPFSSWWFLSLKNFLYVKMVLFSKVIKRKLGVYKIK
ncbi:glycosyltransferase [Flavobacterium sp. GCM10023249]|uniref:glycosyltransferase n=1 Tax=unclassified Flavobacterium TaxID=196869 RepID=UPI003611B71C